MSVNPNETTMMRLHRLVTHPGAPADDSLSGHLAALKERPDINPVEYADLLELSYNLKAVSDHFHRRRVEAADVRNHFRLTLHLCQSLGRVAGLFANKVPSVDRGMADAIINECVVFFASSLQAALAVSHIEPTKQPTHFEFNHVH